MQSLESKDLVPEEITVSDFRGPRSFYMCLEGPQLLRCYGDGEPGMIVRVISYVIVKRLETCKCKGVWGKDVILTMRKNTEQPACGKIMCLFFQMTCFLACDWRFPIDRWLVLLVSLYISGSCLGQWSNFLRRCDEQLHSWNCKVGETWRCRDAFEITWLAWIAEALYQWAMCHRVAFDEVGRSWVTYIRCC